MNVDPFLALDLRLNRRMNEARNRLEVILSLIILISYFFLLITLTHLALIDKAKLLYTN